MPGEVPRVSQAELRRLYEEYVRGVRDPELLEEVSSKLIARGEVWDALQAKFMLSEEVEYAGKEMRTKFKGATYTEVAKMLDAYGFYLSAAFENLTAPLVDLREMRDADYDRRMLAIDRVVHAAHETGYLGDLLIEDHPQRIGHFLEELAYKMSDPEARYEPESGIPGRRPREVRVKRYRRRT
jgi:hypothetical protein